MAISTPRPARSPRAAGGWTRRRLTVFVLTMSPFIALLLLLGWGLFRSGGNPGGLLEHSESGEIIVSARAAPDFSGVDLVSGEPVTNDSVAGNIVMVDFWSSWCAACRIEAADLAEVYREYANAPVEFVGLAIWDQTGDALRHLDRFDVAYPNILDERGVSAVEFGVRGVPEKFFLDKNGTIIRKVTGPVSKENLRAIIDGLLNS
jgi:cytochrome c biogenesis protein CcmG/thiol:disulfide interchange protein DsbE